MTRNLEAVSRVLKSALGLHPVWICHGAADVAL